MDGTKYDFSAQPPVYWMIVKAHNEAKMDI